MASPKENKTTVMRVEMARFEAVPSTEIFDNKGWIIFGPKNDFPFYRIDLYETAPVHSAICKAKIQMVAGKGFDSSAQTEIERLSLDEILPDVSFDKIIQGGYYLEVVYSADGTTVAQVNHLPFENMRLSYVESEDFGRVINGAFYSNDWSNIRKKYNVPRFIPIFNAAKKGIEPRQVLFRFGKVTKGRVYPVVEYESCITWIETEKQIGIFHMNNLLNNLMPAHIINWRNGEPEPDAKARLQRDFSFNEGAKGSGGTLHTFSEPGVEPPKIDTFPISDADKQYQFLVTEARTSIMIGHRVTTPLLFGVREGGGLGSNTDEMRTGLEIFMQNVIEPDQRDICLAIVEILQASGVDATVDIIPNSPIELDEEKNGNVAALALNGAQIESLVNIIIQAATGVITVETAKGVVKAGFPQLKKKQIDDIFASVVVGSVDPTEIVQSKLRMILGLEKKKTALDEFLELGTDAPEGFILVDEFPVDYDNDEEEQLKFDQVNMVSTGSAFPNSKSEQDTTIDGKLFITRYRYRGELKDNTREFCREMLKKDKLYRKEDIQRMENAAVNPGWGPKGANTYDIWFYKGGGECHHFWQKEVYVSAKGFKIDVNSELAPQMAVKAAEAMGYKIRNESLVAKLPVDMPYNGFLPSNPRFN